MARSAAYPLQELIYRIIELNYTQPRISPSWVATEAMAELDPIKQVERGTPLVWLGCHLQLRHIARQKLAKKYVAGGDDSTKDSLFPNLQWRYPTAHSADEDDPEYILRDLMSNEDVAYNVSRLRAEATAKQAHADALEQWGKARR